MAPVIEEGPMLEGVGSIEVVEEENDGKIVDRIVCLPEEDLMDTMRIKKEMLQRTISSLLEDEENEDGFEVVDSLSSTLMETSNSVLDTILYYSCGCTPCTDGTCQPKGILKKPSSGSHRTYGLNKGRSVSFSSLEIKEFNMTLGNHPSATSGPPVMIDWDSEARERVVPLDEYEKERSPRRQRRQLKLSYRDRKGILEQQRGFTPQEVNEAWAEALKIRQQRHETLRRGLVLMTVDDVVESAQRKYRRFIETLGIV